MKHDNLIRYTQTNLDINLT